MGPFAKNLGTHRQSLGTHRIVLGPFAEVLGPFPKVLGPFAKVLGPFAKVLGLIAKSWDPSLKSHDSSLKCWDPSPKSWAKVAKVAPLSWLPDVPSGACSLSCLVPVVIAESVPKFLLFSVPAVTSSFSLVFIPTIAANLSVNDVLLVCESSSTIGFSVPAVYPD